VDFAFTEEQEELRATARSFLADHSGSEAVRAAMASERGFDPALWKRIAGELGWPALGIPEAHGGLGLGDVELVALLETTGEALLCAPLFATAALAAPVILEAGDEEARARWLPGLAEGLATATLVHPGPCGRWGAVGVETVARPGPGDGATLTGGAPLVVDGHTADLLVVPARAPGSGRGEGVSLFVVPGDAPGVTRRPLVTMDMTRRLAEVRLDGVEVTPEARLGEEGEGARPLIRGLERASIALAAEQVGGAQRCLDSAVGYARERVQFGRPIGGFQAIKHKLADVMVAVEAARSGVYAAACTAAAEAEDLRPMASLAKAKASEAYFRAAADALQVFGGVGFTWEYDVHLHLKRARAGEHLLGSPAFHRERVARRLGL
jgi:alkylation response protein AidB-like acyl-CoA dehydrogenase